ncbi:MAG TPA: septal ring lytic transglycosylase RlpA family protein [Falsiroseomonas sp.]|jgi:rare lipoprotein A|nr:septal ring lytic transglycosylase RlpA family protein [Falsiroseomonas sp.]
MTAIHLWRGALPALLALACLGPHPALGFEPQRGTASVYDAAQFTGRQMANGDRFDPAANHAAHRHLPFGTVVSVTNLRTGASTIVVISDRGPFIPGRIIDLSPRSARAIGMDIGLAPVEIRPLEEVAAAP